jgi:hypothetical protein
LLEDLGNIFTGSAKKTFGTFNVKTLIEKLTRIKMVKIKNLGLTTIDYFLEYQSQKIILEVQD